MHTDSKSSDYTALGFPVVFARKITLETGKVKIDLCVKKLACTNLELLGNMEIKAILSFDPELTRRIVNRTVSLSTDFNRRGTTIVRSDETMQKVFTADNIFVGGAGTLWRTKTPPTIENGEVTKRGQIYYDIPIVMEFDVTRIGEESLPHLACMVFPFLRSSDGQPDGVAQYKKTGKINVDIIYENSVLQMESEHIRWPEKTRTPWVKEIHKMEGGGIMFGRTHAKQATDYPDHVYAEVVDTPNSKIQDRRILTKFIDLPAPPPAGNGKLENVAAQFSNIYLAADQHKNVKFLFGIDCGEIYRKNSRFGRNIKNEDFFDQAMSLMEIQSIEVYRHDISRPKEGKRLIALGEEPLTKGAEKRIKHTEYKESQQGSEEKLIGAIEEKMLSMSGKGTGGSGWMAKRVRFFTVTDHEISEFSAGKYGYSVKIKFKDTTEDLLNAKNADLQAASAAIEKYRENADEPKYKDLSLNRFSKKYWYSEDEGSAFGTRKADKLENWINRYIDNLLVLINLPLSKRKELARTIINTTHPISGNIEGLEGLLHLINKLYTKNSDNLIRSNSRNDSGEDSPSDFIPNETSVFEVVKEYLRPEDVYDANCLNNVGASYFDEAEWQGTIENVDPAGPRTITKAKWEERIAIEEKKFPASAKSAVLNGQQSSFHFEPAGNRGSFLSPNSIRLSENVVNLQQNESRADIAAFNSAMTTRTQAKESSSVNEAYHDKVVGEGLNSSKGPMKAMAANSMSLLSDDALATLADPLPSFLQQEVAHIAPIEEQASEYVGENSTFDNAERDKQALAEQTTSTKEHLANESMAARGLMEAIISNTSTIGQGVDNQTRSARTGLATTRQASTIANTNASLNLNSESNYIDNMSIDELAGLPNQIMGLGVSPPSSFLTLNPGEFQIDHTNNAEFNMYYNNLQMLEILTGFDTSITDEKWETLTDDHVDEIGGVALIRMRPYTNGALGIENNFQCPVHNEYFLLGDRISWPETAADQSKFLSWIPIKNDFILPEFLGHYAKLLDPSAVGSAKAEEEKAAKKAAADYAKKEEKKKKSDKAEEKKNGNGNGNGKNGNGKNGNGYGNSNGQGFPPAMNIGGSGPTGY